MLPSPDKPRRIPIIELLCDWVLPIVGGCLTVLVLHWAGIRSAWALLLILPGALAFQWAFLVVISGIGVMLRSRGKKG